MPSAVLLNWFMEMNLVKKLQAEPEKSVFNFVDLV
jgi:hypothetical protein